MAGRGSGLTPKESHKLKLVEYLGNPVNKWPTRKFMATKVLGFSKSEYLYQVFTPGELDEIDTEALALRRKKYSQELSKVDEKLIKEAKAGNVQAIKLCYQKFEDWSERQRREITGKDGAPIQANVTVDPMSQKALSDAIKAAT